MSRALQEAAHPESPAYARTDGQATPEVRRRDGADPRRWRALAVTQLAAFMVLLDVSIVNVALPSIERDLAVSAMTAQWVISGYGLAVGLALVPAGRLGDFPWPAAHVSHCPVSVCAVQCIDRCGADR